MLFVKAAFSCLKQETGIAFCFNNTMAPVFLRTGQGRERRRNKDDACKQLGKRDFILLQFIGSSSKGPVLGTYTEKTGCLQFVSLS